MRVKRQLGQYYTEQNPFLLRPFRAWAGSIGLPDRTVLEPFAGQNNLVRMLAESGLARKFKSFDIMPASRAVARRDTINDFPDGYSVAISNPPWLGRYAAKRRRLQWPGIAYDDLYKHCLRLALDHCDNVAFIIPATFLQSGLFRDRLVSVVFLNRIMFNETENPVCMALFKKTGGRIRIYNDGDFVGRLDDLEKYLPSVDADDTVRFNDPDGNIGLFGIDNTREPSIRFVPGRDVKNDIKFSSRSVTRIRCRVRTGDIDALNRRFNRFRRNTRDVFLTPFKGLRADGAYRRRLDYGLARRLITEFVG